MGKKCCVPHCHTGYRKYNERHPMYGVPKDDFFLNKWQEAIARADRPITPNDCVCQKHFIPDDFSYRRIVKGELEEYKVPKLKPDAVPSIFPEIPDSINGTVKKRRKISLDDEQYKLQKVKKEQEVCNTNNNNSAIDEEHNKYETKQVEMVLCETEIKKEVLDNENNSSQNGAVALCDPVSLEEINIKTEETVVLEEEPGPKIYKCNQCNYSSKWPNNLQTHQIKHLEGEEHYYRCETCPNFKTKWHTTYKNHMKMKHSLGPQEIFACTLCEFRTKIKICLRRHLERHEKGIFERKFRCTWVGCDFKSNSQALLEMHSRRKHSKRFRCSECLFQTNYKKELTKHKNRVHSTGDFDDSVDSNLIFPMTNVKKTCTTPVDNVQKPSTNPVSNIQPSTTSALNVKKPSKIVKKYHSESDFQKCTKCDFRSNSETLLMQHIFKHNYDNLLKYVSQQNTESILAVSESLNDFKCTDCEFKCNLKCEFLKHTLMHRNISVEKLNKN